VRKVIFKSPSSAPLGSIRAGLFHWPPLPAHSKRRLMAVSVPHGESVLPKTRFYGL